MHKIWLPESIGEPLYLWAIDKQVSLYMMIALWALSSHTGASSPKVRLPMMPVAYGSRSTDPCKAPICNLHVLHVHLKPPSGVCILPAAQMNSGSPSNQRSRSYGTFTVTVLHALRQLTSSWRWPAAALSVLSLS